MRISKYEIILPLPESETQDYVLINGLYGAVDLVDKNEAQLLTEAKNNPALLEKLESSRLELLTNRGHIVNSDEQESEDMSIIARIHKLLYSSTGVGLVLAPTYNCNLRCFYCVERQRLTRGTEWLERTMSKSLVDAIFAQVKDYKARDYRLNDCTLYGGEPLLAENKDIIRYICEKCRENDMKISAITNGTDLDKYLDLIQEFKFTNLQITVDGPREIHDKRRFFADGSGSFDKIMNNIALALERDIKINVRVNVGRLNLAYISELEHEFKSRGFTDKKNFGYYFRGVFDSPDSINETEILQKLIDSGHSLYDAIELENFYSGSVRNLQGWLNKKVWPKINPTYCGTQNAMNVIGPDGLIYACWNIVSKDELAMGFVDEDSQKFLYNLSMTKWRTRYVNNMTPCKDCEYAMLCGGGCAKNDPEENMYTGLCANFQEVFNYTAPWAITQFLNDSKSKSKSDSDSDSKKDNSENNDNSKQGEKKPERLPNSEYINNPRCLSLSTRELLARINPDERKQILTSTSPLEVLKILVDKA